MAKHNEISLAGQRAKKMLSAHPRVTRAWFDRMSKRVVIELTSKLIISISPRDAQGLESATPWQLAEIELSPSGLGLHFPRLDADLYIPGLLNGMMGSAQWMASRLGAIGGRSRSMKKRAAARANGKHGGRPRLAKSTSRTA